MAHSERVEDGHARRLQGDGRVRGHEVEVGRHRGDEDTVDQARARRDKLTSELCAIIKNLRGQRTVKMTATSCSLTIMRSSPLCRIF